MKHVIIGGNGFTGRFLAEQLAHRGEKVMVADITKRAQPGDCSIDFENIDIRSKRSLRCLKLDRDDIVHHLAATQYHGNVPRRGRKQYFDDVNVFGTSQLLEYMQDQGCRNLVYFSTDMVYGIPQTLPVTTEHEQRPLGPYGESKCRSEKLCRDYRNKGFKITIFRPRLIVGAGRLGVLRKLFHLIARGLPVPLIGNGTNHYQMVSVHDCVSADLLAVEKGIPNSVYNLGSKDPPTVKELLEKLIETADSKSRLIRTPGKLVKGILGMMDVCGLTILYKEQYAIADINYLVDVSKTESALDWHPSYRDEDMLFQAFKTFMQESKLTQST